MVRPFAVLLAVILVAAGCGGGTADDGSAGPVPTVDTDVPSEQPAPSPPEDGGEPAAPEPPSDSAPAGAAEQSEEIAAAARSGDSQEPAGEATTATETGEAAPSAGEASDEPPVPTDRRPSRPKSRAPQGM